jgi:hypothetical protein
MDFFNAVCQEPPRNTNLFGLCDDQLGGKAYSDIATPNNWVATVRNEKNKTLVFTAIDKCVIKDHEEIGRGRCDGMLISDSSLYLVELKNSLPPWQSIAIEQLESTIQFLTQYHAETIKDYTHKKAFACNKIRARFQVIDNEINMRFFRTYGFRIDIQAEIIIV